MIADLPWVDAAWSHFWQLSLSILVVGALTAFMHRRPHVCYALWMVVLLKAVTPPLWTSNLSVFGWLGEPAPPSPLSTDQSSGQANAELLPAPPIAPAGRKGAAHSLDARAASASKPAAEGRGAFAIGHATRWLAVWTVGAVALGSMAAAASVRRRRCLRAASRAPDAQLASQVEQLARELRLAAAPRVLVSDCGLGPAVCGVFGPALVVPRSIVDDSAPETLRAVLVHELVHLRRRDHWATGLQAIAQIVWWFHPLAWWANKQLCRVREACCDAETVEALGGPPRRYARALVDVLEAKCRVRPVWGFPGVRPLDVTAFRIKEILAMSDRLLTRSPLSSMAAAAVAAVLLLPSGRGTLRSVNAAPAEAAAEAAPDGPSDAAKKPAAKPVLLLKYGDGKPDGKKSIAGAGEMIRFTMPEGQNNALRALRIHAARYGYPQAPDEDVEISVLTEDMSDVIHTELVPYRLFKRQAEPRWVVVPFEDPVDLPTTFWIVLNFNAEATKGVYVSFDTSSKGQYSRFGFNDQDAKETQFGGDWMVQAMLAK